MMLPPPPVGEWFAVSCATCGLLVGWTRGPMTRPFFCIPHFDQVAHLSNEEIDAAIPRPKP